MQLFNLLEELGRRTPFVPGFLESDDLLDADAEQRGEFREEGGREAEPSDFVGGIHLLADFQSLRDLDLSQAAFVAERFQTSAELAEKLPVFFISHGGRIHAHF